jgi:hypothetical protein
MRVQQGRPRHDEEQGSVHKNILHVKLDQETRDALDLIRSAAGMSLSDMIRTLIWREKLRIEGEAD